MGAPGNMPTLMQVQALENIREGMRPGDAMIKAGYSPKTAKDPKTNLLDLKGPQKIIEKYRAEYERQGITPKYMAKKTKEWLEARERRRDYVGRDDDGKPMYEITVQPDYQTQIKAAELVRKDWNLGLDMDVNINNILVIPNEVASKYGISYNTAGSSDEQQPV